MKQVVIKHPTLPTSRQMAIAVRAIQEEWPGATFENVESHEVYDHYYAIPFALLGALNIRSGSGTGEHLSIVRGAREIVVTTTDELMIAERVADVVREAQRSSY